MLFQSIISTILLFTSFHPLALSETREECEELAVLGDCYDEPEVYENCKSVCDQWMKEVGDYAEDFHSFYDLKAKDIDGNLVDFEEFQGKVLIIVNVASYCGKLDITLTYQSPNYLF